MAKLSTKRGTQSNTLTVFIQDNSSTTGAGLTGLTYNSTNLQITVRRQKSATVTVYKQSAGNIESITTLGTFETPTASKCRFKEIDSTNAKGQYEIHLPNAHFDTSDTSNNLVVTVMEETTTALKIAPAPAEIELTGSDNQDSVRMGLTALPNAAAEASGGLYTRGTGAGQINQDANGRIDTNIAAISTDSTAADNLESYCDGTTPIPSNTTQIGGVAQSLTDLKDFVDSGYDPSTHKVEGIKLSDSLTGLANNAITANSINNGAITVDKLASDCITGDKIAAGAIAKGDQLTGLNDLSLANIEATTVLAKKTDIVSLATIEGSTVLAKTTDITGLNDLSLSDIEATTILAKKTDITALNDLSLADIEATTILAKTTDITSYLPMAIKKNTALNNFMIKMVLASDGETPATGLTITAQRSIDGGAFSSCANSVTEISGGAYKINLAASDLNGNCILLDFSSATAKTLTILIVTHS